MIDFIKIFRKYPLIFLGMHLLILGIVGYNLKFVTTSFSRAYQSNIQPLLPDNRLFAENFSMDNFMTGGTNYRAYDMGDYQNTPTQENLDKSDATVGSIKTTIGSYDMNPQLVKSQLKHMCDQGQRKIGLMIWFAPYPDGMKENQTYAAGMLNSKGGRLTTRHASNLVGLLSSILETTTNDNRLCYNEIQIRFAPVSSATALGWDVWDEAQYQENKNFIFSTRDLVTRHVRFSKVKVFFDLGAEEGGRTENQITKYSQKLWAEYVKKYGTNDTYGFSIAWSPGRLRELYTIYQKIGKFPNQYALDIYDTDNTGLSSEFSEISREMGQIGIANAPILVQETFFSNRKTYTEFVHAKRSLKINIRAIMQWQLEQNKLRLPDGSFRHISTIDSTYLYAAIPQTESIGIGCEDKKCIWIKGRNFSDNCTITIFSDAWQQLQQIRAPDAYCSDTYATIRIPEKIYGSLTGIRVMVANKWMGWSDALYIRIK